MPTIQEIKDFFFKAMVNGYANAGSQKIKMPDWPGHKAILFREGKFVLLDVWCTAPNSKVSSGTTTIWYGSIVVWVMHYGGWYEEWVTPFLKRALMRNYEEGFFLGGRGPERLEGEDHTLQYLNGVERYEFSDFKGSERIIATSHQTGVPVGTKLGEHDYFGMTFI